jgi:hypothetical protein
MDYTLPGALFGHGVSDDFACAGEGLGGISGQLHCHDLHSLILSLQFEHSGLIAEDGGSSSIRGGTALQLGQDSVDFGALEDFLD